MRRVAEGDARAFAELYDRHARPVFSLVLRIVIDHDEAQDLVQEVFAQAWTQAGRYDAARGPVSAWLLTIARSRAIDRLRSRRGRSAMVAADPSQVADVRDPAASQETEVLNAEQLARLRGAIAELPLLQRLALELAYFEGLSHTEVAERLEEPLGTVKTRIRAALQRLRGALAAQNA
jgi:RNA polymerase sigma-70 factor (ECF subfamily)